MGILWTPLFGFVVFTLAFGLIGNFFVVKTKGIISACLVGCAIYLFGNLTGIIPGDSIANTGIPAMMGSFGLALMITNLGTMLDTKTFLREWKTVIISIAGLVGIAAIAFSVGSWIFSREYALCAASPISGGIIAAILTADAVNAAGRSDLATYAVLINSLQLFVGIPITSQCLKKETARLLQGGLNNSQTASVDTAEGRTKRKLIRLPAWMDSADLILFRVALVALIAQVASKLTILPGRTDALLNVNIAYLIFGVLFTEIGFLRKESLQNAGSMGFLTICLVALLPGNFANATWEGVRACLLPMVGMLLLGGIGIAIFSIIAGKFLGYSVPMSIAIGCTALIGYPLTQILTEEVLSVLDIDEETKQKLNNALLPKMLVGGFTTVTIASVVFAGIVVPMIF